MLSKNQVVKYRKALERGYEGVCTITNKQEYEKTNGSIGFKDVVIVKDQPCRLSFSNSPVAQAGSGIYNASQSIKLFLAPEIEVKAGSIITITQHGVTNTYQCSGLPIKRDSHQSVELEVMDNVC